MAGHSNGVKEEIGFHKIPSPLWGEGGKVNLPSTPLKTAKNGVEERSLVM